MVVLFAKISTGEVNLNNSSQRGFDFADRLLKKPLSVFSAHR